MDPSDLSASFVSAVGEAYALSPVSAASLQPLLVELLDAARAAWPGVAVSGTGFATHLARVAPETDDVLGTLREMHTNDLFLAAACIEGDAEAPRAFERRMLPGAAKAVARVDADATFVQDVCAELRVRLLVPEGGLPRIASYLGRGPMLHWVQVSAMRLAQTAKRRAKKREVPVDVAELALSVLDDAPDVAPLAAQLKGPFEAAFRAAMGDLTARERNLLRLYLVEEVSSEAIAVMYRVHRATVARWIARARRQVQIGTRKRLAEQQLLESSSFESVMGQVLDGIDLSIASVLGR